MTMCLDSTLSNDNDSENIDDFQSLNKNLYIRLIFLKNVFFSFAQNLRFFHKNNLIHSDKIAIRCTSMETVCFEWCIAYLMPLYRSVVTANY